MPDEKPDSKKPAAEKPKKPTGIELTEEDLQRVSGGKKGEETKKDALF